jgi:DNA-binding winged helix-turn-helix (wHTH) protein
MEKLYFGEFSVEIDEARCHGVFRGDEPLALSDMPRKVLFALLKQRPRPVIAKELLSELWRPDANPSNVAKQVRALRRALDDDDAQHYIRTLNKEGYAFVMPVAKTPLRTSSVNALQHRAISSNAGAASDTRIEWSLATEKLLKDFRGSCLHDHELLAEAIEECDRRIQLLVEHRGVKPEGRFPHETLFVPPRSTWSSSTGPDPEIAARAAELIEHSRTKPLVIDVGSYSAACLAVLQSLRQRYGLETRTDFEALTGRQQVLRLQHMDAADFLFAPHVPVVLVGDFGALDYRRITPVHSYEQVLLRRAGAARGKKRRVLVYKGGYPEEQMLTGIGIPESAEPEMVGSLERLIENVQGLAPGDMVIAWQPLASGLESKSTFTRLGEYRCWVSLYCHKRWHRGALRTLKDQFQQLFASEWAYCRWHKVWAIECLGMEPTALESFAAGSGLGPASGPSEG